MIGTIIISLLVFGFLIFIHEFGHYITARIFNVTIKEFSIGMGPKLAWYESKKTGITYGIAMFPIGGYVAMVGEDEESDDPNAFNKKPAWQRLIITAAGATVNIVAGFLAMLLLVVFIDVGGTVYAVPVTDEDMLTIENVDVSYRSEDYGLINGDRIVSINGKKIKLDSELDYQISRFGHEPVDVVVMRDGNLVTLEDVRFPTVEQQGQVFGVRDFKVYRMEKNFFNVFSISFRKAALIMRMCWESIFDLITGRYTVEAISGPVGISSAIGTAAKRDFGSLVNIAVLISMNLGFMNLLPIPALDGGRIVMILAEMITRKKIPSNVEAMINGIGLGLLLLISVVIMFKDIIGLF